MHDGELKAVYHKVFLQNDGVFDEQRYFEPGHRSPIVEYDGARVGLSVCEDAWYPSGPMAWQAHHGGQLLININGSPYHAGKRAPREAMIRERAVNYGAYVAWVNTVGGQDELVFDGNSVVFGPRGEVIAHAQSFVEELLVCDIDVSATGRRPIEEIPRDAPGAERLELVVTEVPVATPASSTPKAPFKRRIAEPLEGAAEIYSAVVLGTHDYIRKQGFHKVIIGLSGGADCALPATIACNPLAPQNVSAFPFPARHPPAA